MSGIPSINERAAQPPSYIDQASELTKGQGLNETSKEVVRDALAVIGTVLRVSNTPNAAPTGEVGTSTGATGIPALDNPADAVAMQAALEKLLAYLKLENDEQQAAMAKDRIEIQKDEIEKRHGEEIEKIKETMKEMDKAAKAALATKIFGWLMAALAVVFAVVASIATGGAAVGAIVGAVVAVGMAVANETGAIEKLTEKLADSLKDAGLSDRAAQILAAVIIALAAAAISIGSGFGATGIANAVAKGAETAAKVTMSATQAAAQVAKTVTQLVMGAMGLATLGAGVGATVQGYKAGIAQSELTEMQKFLAIISQRLEESEEELQEILNQIQNSIAGIIEILTSETDTQKEIAQQMGAMV